MGYVTLNIEGLSASYYKNDIWNVIFPCDKKYHTVKFFYLKDSVISSPISLNSSTIRITTEGAVPPKYPYNPSYEMLMDLTSNDLHKEGIKFVSDIQEGKDKSIMIVANAHFFAAETKKRRNYITDRNGDSVKTICSEYASIVGAEIELEEDGKVIMEVEGPNPSRIDFEGGEELYFDNDCHNCLAVSTVNDFEYYQDIFENSDHPGLKFKVWSFSLSPRVIKDPNFKDLFAPAPLFCDGMRISKTDDL